MIELDSTHLKAAEYTLDTMILKIEFQAGGVYDYYRVPEEIYQGLLEAESKSQYFRDNIKDIFAFMRVL